MRFGPLAHSASRGNGASYGKAPDSELVEVLEQLIAERRWAEIDPVQFLRVFQDLSEDARALSSEWSDCGAQARETLERLVTAAVGGAERRGTHKPRPQPDAEKLPLPDCTYLAEIGAQLQRYQEGAAALAVFEAIQAAAGGDSTAILEERIFAELMSRRELVLKSDSGRQEAPERSFPGSQTLAREVLSEPALRITAAAAARELMLAYRRLVQQLKTEQGIRRHFGIRERNRK